MKHFLRADGQKRKLTMSFSDEELIPRICAGETNSLSYSLSVIRTKYSLHARIKEPRGCRRSRSGCVREAFRALSKFKGDAQFGTWLYRIAYNVCLTNWNRERIFFSRLMLHSMRMMTMNILGSSNWAICGR